MTTPLLIGGATTSRIHTAVKIEPAYSSPVIHVADASRAVAVAGSLLDKDGRAGYATGSARNTRSSASSARTGATARPASRSTARANRLVLDWTAPPPRPSFLGVRTFDEYPLPELVERIDWTPFFQTWELRGAWPAILADPVVGAAPRAARGRRRAARAHRRRAAPHGVRGRGVLAGQRDAGRRHRDLGGRGADDRARAPARRPPADGQARRPPERVDRRLRRPGRRGRLHRRLRRDRGQGHDRSRGGVRGGARRLFRDHGPRPRRSARRGLRGATPRTRPPRALGLRAPTSRCRTTT